MDESFVSEEYLDDDDDDGEKDADKAKIWAEHAGHKGEGAMDPENTTSYEQDPLHADPFDETDFVVDSDESKNESVVLPADEDNETVFAFTGVFFRKLYRSQLRPKECGSQSVNGNSVPEVLKSVWGVARKQIHRAVIYENEVPHWVDDDPKEDDIGSFVTMQDISKKKLYTIAALTPRLLRNWRGKPIKVFVHVYSTNVENNTQYQQIYRKLLSSQNPDRSGASSTLEESSLANELRDGHPDIEGHHSSWMLWANFINSSPAHERDRLKQAKAPPLDLTKFFRWSSVSEAARLQSLNRGLVVAQTVNQSWSKEIADLRKDADLAVSILQGMVNRLNVLESRANTDLELLAAMTSATQPEERELSRTLSERVVDCADVDHS